MSAKFKIGDKVMVNGKAPYSNFDILEVVEIGDSSQMVSVKCNKYGGYTDYIHEEYLDILKDFYKNREK